MATEGTGQECAAELGQGWKVSPAVGIKTGQTFEVADIDGPGLIEQIWMTPSGNWRFSIIRIYWDDQEYPSVECPVGDFFACGWGEYAQVSSLAVCVNPGSAFNCYWPMPFRKRCRITFENIADEDMVLFYQVNYSLGDVDKNAAYFHAQFRRVNPLPEKEVYTIVDEIRGCGRYVGTYMAWMARSPGWWGEGEIKFFMDGDRDFPTICGTGTEDYFCGSYGFQLTPTGRYEAFSTPYAGLPQIIGPDEPYQPGTKFGMYRWHITDPIRFQKDLRVTIQALGWNDGQRYRLLDDDIASVAYWYQTLPGAEFPALPPRDCLAIT